MIYKTIIYGWTRGQIRNKIKVRTHFVKILLKLKVKINIGIRANSHDSNTEF